MNKYIFHYFKWIKSLVIRPIQTIRWLKSDFKKDHNSKSFTSPHKKVWCAGLPKSGTTLVEKILDILPYVRLNNSFYRVYLTGKEEHDHGISNYNFNNLTNDKFTFLKTHTHYEKKYENIAKNHNLRIIISMRDLRDMLISRYFHIMNDNSHWLHYQIKDLNFTDGFISSLKNQWNKNSPNALNYYYHWINDWYAVARKNGYLILWFEDFKKDRKKYIENILKYLNFEEFSINEIEEKISNPEKNKKKLSESLKSYGRSKDTFRKGEAGEWKKYFNKSINEYFEKNVPGPIDNVSYEYLKKKE